MQIDEAGIARGLGVAVGHADHGGFLQAQHIVDIVGPVGEERQFGRAGIAEHFLDAERAQQVERGLLDGDGCGGGLAQRFARITCGVLYGDWIPASLRSRNDEPHHVAVPFIVGWPSEFAVHNSMPAAVSLALTLNSLPSNSGCSPR